MLPDRPLGHWGDILTGRRRKEQCFPGSFLRRGIIAKQPATPARARGGAWWIQNSYEPKCCGPPFYTEPCVTFLQNAQDLWFDQIGDGKMVWK